MKMFSTCQMEEMAEHSPVAENQEMPVEFWKVCLVKPMN